MKLQLLKLPRCHVCLEVTRILDEEIVPQFPETEIEVIDMTSERGRKLMVENGIDTSPAIFIEGEFFSMGPLRRKQELIERLSEAAPDVVKQT